MTRKNTIFVFVSYCMMFSLVMSAKAQQKDTGPVRISVRLLASQTDNRDSYRDADAESNTDLYLIPKLSFSTKSDQGSLAFHYMPGYRYRTDPGVTQNDSEWQHDFGLSFYRKLAPRTDFRISEDLNITDDPSIQKNGSTLRRDSSYTLNRAQASIARWFTQKSRGSMNIRHTLKQYDLDERAVESDEDIFGSAFTLWRMITETFGGLVSADYSIFDYTSGTNNYDRAFTAYGFGIGAEKRFSKDSKLIVRGGLRSVDYDDVIIEDDSTPYASAAYIADLSAKTKLTLRGNYTLRKSDVFPYASQVQTDFTAKVAWDAATRVNLAAAVTYRNGSYEMETLPDGSDSIAGKLTGDEDTIIGVVELYYDINYNTKLKVAQRFEDVSTDLAYSYDYTRNSTSVSVSRLF